MLKLLDLLCGENVQYVLVANAIILNRGNTYSEQK